ncbi:MAG TPA: peptidase M13 [Hyphomonadaceae bacterium]|nr:peptidase M13 [Hyphomonadaceae bacterium]
MNRRRLILLAAASALAACAHEAAPPPAPPAPLIAKPEPLIKPWGYPLDALDRSVKPGDDFFRFANGGWLDATPIPADRQGTGFSVQMSERNEARFRQIIAELLATPQARGADSQRIRDFYRAYMDEAAIEAKGLAPAQAGLAQIAAAQTHADIARLLAEEEIGVAGPFNAGVGIDAKDPNAYSVSIGQAGLGLPDRDYYLSDNPRLAAARTAYRAHIARMFALIGADPLDADAKAARILTLETDIAILHWPNERRRQADQTYNPVAAGDLPQIAPGFPWSDYLTAYGAGGVTTFILREKDSFAPLAELFAKTSVADWKSYLSYHFLRAHAAALPKAFDEEAFAFFGRELGGQQEQRSRDNRAIEALNGVLDQAMGKIYVERFLPPEAKAQMTEMFENIRWALGERIKGLAWMSPATKEAALSKLAQMQAKIAFPEKWRDFSRLKIRPDDHFGNIVRARAFARGEALARLGKPVDKREWFTGPQTINAFYSPNRNEAFIPAGYMQPPLFDAYADPAVNYGAIGSIIGHEIGHGFDDQGSKYDGRGELRSWWTAADRAAFDAAGAALADQYSQFEPLPGQKVNGRLTLGENLGDLVGMLVTVEAYKRSLKGAEAPVLDGFTGVQRVFLGRAQARRFKQTEAALRRQIVQGPHSPHAYRVNGVVRNVDSWYEAFAVAPGDALYLAPAQRVRAW